MSKTLKKNVYLIPQVVLLACYGTDVILAESPQGGQIEGILYEDWTLFD